MGRIGIKDLVKPTDEYKELKADLKRADQEGKKASLRAINSEKTDVMERLAELAVDLVEEYKKRQNGNAQKAAKKV
jgi:hypothetical protein